MTLTNRRIVHILRGGRPLCGFTEAVPGEWESGHAWADTEDPSINCPDCLKAKPISSQTKATISALNKKFNEEWRKMEASSEWKPVKIRESGTFIDILTELERTLNEGFTEPEASLPHVLAEARELMSRLRYHQGRRQSGRGVYYDFKVSMLETAAQIISGFAAQDGRKVGPYMRGVYFGRNITDEELRAWDDSHHQEYNDLIDIQVRDNGENGDGIWIDFVAHERKRAKDPRDDDDRVLFAIELEPAQAEIFAETLRALTKLRGLETTKGELDRAMRDLDG